MASLSNINGLFDVHSTGAILFSTSHGTSGQILKSNGNAAPTWVDASTVIGGPYLPLTGGTLTGNLAISGSNSLTVGGALSAGVTTITSDTGLIVYSSTNAVGANITFSDVTNRTQSGSISYFHQDTASYGSANAFVITSDQDTMTVLADGKLMYKEGVYLKPATGTGAGTRKDNLWDAAYNDKITALAVTGTTTKTLTATQQDGGTLTATWTDNDSGGTVTGTGANTQVAFWTGTSVIDGSSDLRWDNTNKELGIGRNPDYPLDVYKSSNTSGTATGTTVQRLWNYVGGDLNQQKTFIDFVFQDGNDNEYPQVRIGAEVGQNGDADTQIKEGSGAFVVYTNNATSAGPGSPTGLAERFRVDYAGNVGIGTVSPDAKLDLGPAGGIKQYVYSDGGNVRMGFGVDLSGSSRELSIFHPSSNSVNGDISFGYRYESTGAYYERMRITGAGNVGIGNTSPGAKLDVGATIHPNTTGIDVTGVNCIGLNTVDNHNWFPYTDGNNYYSATKHQFRGGTNNGPNYMMLDSTGLGIGNTSPVYKLDITGSGMRIKDVGDVEIIVNADTDNADETHSPVMRFLQDGTQNMLNVGSNGSSGTPDYTGLLANNAYIMGGTGHSGTVNLQIGTGGVALMMISRASALPLIGIGKTDPAYTLDVAGEIGLDSYIRHNGDTNTFFGFSANDEIKFRTSGSDRMSIGSGGIINVPSGARIDIGAGTWKNGSYPNNPAARLNVECEGDNAINIYNTQENYAYLRFIDSQSNGAQYARIGWSSGSGNPMVINNMGNDAITISGTGDVGINNTNPTYRFHIKSSNNISIFEDTSDASGAAFIVFNRPGVFSMGSITRNGSANSIAYNTGSDYRLKEDLKDFNALELVNNITAYNYKWKDVDQRDYGFIAHELEQTLPNVVTGKKDGEKMQGVDYSKLTPILLKAIQELEARVKELENR